MTVTLSSRTPTDQPPRQQPRARMSTCSQCGAPTTATGRRGPVPSTCTTCKRQRSAARYIRAAARIAEDMKLQATARELRQLATHIEQH